MASRRVDQPKRTRKTYLSIVEGSAFGKLTVVSAASAYMHPTLCKPIARWNLQCECGQTVSRHQSQLNSGQSRDCGCGRRFKPFPVGCQIGRLRVTGVDVMVAGNRKVPCQCDCGRDTLPFAFSLAPGGTRSCGKCDRHSTEATRKAVGDANRTHGMTKTPEYQAWLKMRRRCHNPSDAAYPNYGARGIAVCDEWRDSFEAFYAYIGPKAGKQLSLDRIDNDRGYEPGNVRWADGSTQNRNRRAFLCDPSNRRKTSARRRAPTRVSKSWREGKCEYNSWIGMKMRCLNPNDGRFHQYGGRGITVALEWVHDFPAFLAYVGPKPAPDYSLDRIDNDGNYEPGNVRWADRETQIRNRRPFMVRPKEKCGV